MMSISRSIQLINHYITTRGNEAEEALQPIAYEDLVNNHALCGTLIDFLGDIYVCSGMDADDHDTPTGSQIQQLITFLAGLVPEELG